MKRIAISGLARTGKDTIGLHLIDKHNYNKVSFAEPLYDILHYAQRVCGFGNNKDRQFLQYIGTDWARQKDEDIWINLAKNNILSLDKVVITDLRFKNEYDALKNLGFTFIRVERDETNRSEFGSGSKLHQSELELNSLPHSSFDLVINNNGNLCELYSQIDNYLVN